MGSRTLLSKLIGLAEPIGPILKRPPPKIDMGDNALVRYLTQFTNDANNSYRYKASYHIMFELNIRHMLQLLFAA